MRRILFTLSVCCALAQGMQEAADPPTTADLISATANMAAIFARTAPGLVARETLHQRGRRGFIRLLQQNENGKSKNATIKLPQDFRTHDVVSEYALGQIGASRVIHEIRSVLTIDGRVISGAEEARHALAIGIQSSDDELKHRLLENFERNRLEGAVTDFGQLILLFGADTQSHYEFTRGAERTLDGEPMLTLQYKQNSGSTGLTVFHERTVKVRLTEGEIWLRARDLLPVRITMLTQESLGENMTVRDQATVDYTPTPFGLAPAHILHSQLLNDDLLVENDLQYSGYQRLTPGVAP